MYDIWHISELMAFPQVVSRSSAVAEETAPVDDVYVPVNEHEPVPIALIVIKDPGGIGIDKEAKATVSESVVAARLPKS
jgi:hypothetical protein